MTKKEYLGQAYRIDQRINSKIEQIAVAMDYSIQHIYRLRDKAVKEITLPAKDDRKC